MNRKETIKFPFNIPLFGYVWKPHLFDILWKYKSVFLFTAVHKLVKMWLTTMLSLTTVGQGDIYNLDRR